MPRRMGTGRSMRGAGQSMRGGTYFTPDGPRRLPGAAPQYDRRPTIFYKSRRLRYWRGANLEPDRRENVGGFGTLKYRFWFRSPRGPASTGGFHIVEADLNNDPGGGGGGGGVQGPGNCATSYWVTVRGNWQPYSAVISFNQVEAGLRPNPPTSWPQLTSDLNIRQPVPGPLGAISWELTSIPPTIPGRKAFLYRVWLTFALGKVAVYATNIQVGLSAADPAADTLVITEFTPIRLDGGADNCTGNAGEFPPGSLGGSNGLPRYTCTCPDYSRQEQPYLNPLWPSQRRSRSWLSSRAGSDGYCKHIYSAAFRLGDQAVVGRVPGGLLPPGEVPDFFKWLRWNNQLLRQQRARERAYARQQLGEARRAGEGARDRYYRNLVERTNEVLSVARDRGIPSVQVPGYRTSGYRNLAYDRYAYEALTSVGYTGTFERITTNNRPQPAVEGSYGGDAFDAANPRSRPVQTGTGFANPPLEREPVFAPPDAGPNPLLSATALPLRRAIRPQNPVTGAAGLVFSGGVNRVGIVAGATNQLRRLRGPATAIGNYFLGAGQSGAGYFGSEPTEFLVPHVEP